LTCIQSTQGFFPYKLVASPEELKETVESIRSTKAKTEFERKQLDKVATHLESDRSANLQMVFLPLTLDFEGGLNDQSLLGGKMREPGGPYGMTMVIIVSYPASRGSVHITSGGMFTPNRQLTYLTYGHRHQCSPKD
jgi:hypothetical protein